MFLISLIFHNNTAIISSNEVLIFDIAVACLSICSAIMPIMFSMSWLASQSSGVFVYPCLSNKFKCNNKKESGKYFYPFIFHTMKKKIINQTLEVYVVVLSGPRFLLLNRLRAKT